MTTLAPPARIAGYRRVSTEEQSTKDHVSLDTQAARIAAFAERSSGLLVRTFTDVASGRKDNRVEYQRLLDFVRAGHADVIAVQWLDRFGRNPREILRRVWELQEAGIEVVCTDEDVKEELALLVRAGLAGAESKRTSERVMATIRDAARRGRRGGTPPYGYRKVPELSKDENGVDVVRVHYEHVSDEVALIRHAMGLVETENLGYLKLAERLHDEGYRTRSGSMWTAAGLHKTLNNVALLGTYIVGAQSKVKSGDIVTVERFFDPPILSREEWDAFQARLATRREHPRGQTHSSPYLLSGIARCGYCGSTLVGQRTTSRGHVYLRYICGGRIRGKQHCDQWNMHPQHKLEAAVLDHLGQYVDPKRVRELLAAQATTAKSTGKAELAKAQRELAKLDDDLNHDVDQMRRGVLDESDFATVNAGRRERRTGLSETVERLTAQLAQENAASDAVRALPQRIRTFAETVRTADPRLAKAELQMILAAVHVTRDAIEIEFRQ